MKTTEEQRAELRRLADKHSLLKWPELIDLLDDFAELEAQVARLTAALEAIIRRVALVSPYYEMAREALSPVPARSERRDT